MKVNTADTFWARVEKSEWCWDWTGGRGTKGYGAFCMDGVTRPAHHFPLMFAGYAIPMGHVVDHLCRNKTCVNPDHLEIVTAAENTLRANPYRNKGKRAAYPDWHPLAHRPKSHTWLEDATYMDEWLEDRIKNRTSSITNARHSPTTDPSNAA